MDMAYLQLLMARVGMKGGGRRTKYLEVAAIYGLMGKAIMGPGSTTKCTELGPTNGVMVGFTLARTLWTRKKHSCNKLTTWEWTCMQLKISSSQRLSAKLKSTT